MVPTQPYMLTSILSRNLDNRVVPRVDRGNAHPRGNAPNVNISYFKVLSTNEQAPQKARLLFILRQSFPAGLIGRRRCSALSFVFYGFHVIFTSFITCEFVT